MQNATMNSDKNMMCWVHFPEEIYPAMWMWMCCFTTKQPSLEQSSVAQEANSISLNVGIFHEKARLVIKKLSVLYQYVIHI